MAVVSAWVFVFALTLNYHAASAQSAEPAAVTPSPLCRFGVNTARPIGEFDVSPLRVGWYVDYGASGSPALPNGAQHMPIINLKETSPGKYIANPSGDQLDAAIAANPGAHWIIGNEPDRRKYQNDLLPGTYAQAYHDLYQQIKAKDPTARIFAGAIVQPTELRLKYLDLVLEAYALRYGATMPVDGWAIHNFILNERSCSYYDDPFICWGADIPPGIDAVDGLVITIDELDKTGDINLFKAQIERFRRWMFNRGYADKPLYLSEYGILMPEDRGFPVDKVNAFMNDTFDYLLTKTHPQLGYEPDGDRLVQRLSWYSTVDLEFNGSLFQHLVNGNPVGTPPFQLSPFGQNFRNYTANIAEIDDFAVLQVQLEPPAVVRSTQPITFVVSATIGNSGNKEKQSQAIVRFYNGNPERGGVQIGSDRPIVLRGCGDTAVVSMVWSNVAPATAVGRTLYARVIAAGTDTNQDNNQKQYAIFRVESQVFLPSIRRQQAAGW